MERLLYINTADPILEVGIAEGTTWIETFKAQEANQQAEMLAYVTQQMLMRAEGGLTGIVFNNGPGSYTGLRVGLSFIKGLAYALQVPVCPINSNALQAFAAASQFKWDGPILAVEDARRMEVWFMACLGTKPLSETIAAVPDSEFGQSYFKTNHQKILVTGNGAEKLTSILANSTYFFDLEKRTNLAAMKQFVTSNSTDIEPVSIIDLKPNYGKPVFIK